MGKTKKAEYGGIIRCPICGIATEHEKTESSKGRYCDRACRECWGIRDKLCQGCEVEEECIDTKCIEFGNKAFKSILYEERRGDVKELKNQIIPPFNGGVMRNYEKENTN